MTWFCDIEAKTTGYNGRTIVMNRRFTPQPYGDFKAQVLSEIARRADRGAPFVGCEIVCSTPTAVQAFILEESFGVYRLDAAIWPKLGPLTAAEKALSEE